MSLFWMALGNEQSHKSQLAPIPITGHSDELKPTKMTTIFDVSSEFNSTMPWYCLSVCYHSEVKLVCGNRKFLNDSLSFWCFGLWNRLLFMVLFNMYSFLFYLVICFICLFMYPFIFDWLNEWMWNHVHRNIAFILKSVHARFYRNAYTRTAKQRRASLAVFSEVEAGWTAVSYWALLNWDWPTLNTVPERILNLGRWRGFFRLEQEKQQERSQRVCYFFGCLPMDK